MQTPAQSTVRHDAVHNRTLGAEGEDLAVKYLERAGYRIIQRNWRCGRLGELDIVAEREGTLVAVEVKTRSGVGYGHPLEAITVSKARRIRQLLLAWVRERRPRSMKLRIDAIGIVLRSGESPSIHHVEGIG